MEEYTVVVNNSSKGLEEEVRWYLRQGYVAVGGVSVAVQRLAADGKEPVYLCAQSVAKTHA